MTALMFGISPQEVRQTWTWEMVKMEHHNAMDLERIRAAERKASPGRHDFGHSHDAAPVKMTAEQFTAMFGTKG